MGFISDYVPSFDFENHKMAYDLAMIYTKAHVNEESKQWNSLDKLLRRFVLAYTTFEEYTPEKLMCVYNDVNRDDFDFKADLV